MAGNGCDDSGHPKKTKAVGLTRRWLILDSAGNTQVLEAGKNVIMRRTGLPARDLRILDPVLGYPASLLSRERAVVVNMEHVKAIVTAHDVLLLNSKDPSVAPFVEELRLKILCHHHSVQNKWSSTRGDNADCNGGSKSEGPQPHDQDEGNQAVAAVAGVRDQHALEAPFEFVALEACVESACSCLDNEARMLEQEVYPALNKLTSHVCSPNLEHVKQIKGRLITLTKRVQKVRDELESLLNDDEHMAGMYLTDKLLEWQCETRSISSVDEEAETDDDEVNESNICDAGQHGEDSQQLVFRASKIKAGRPKSYRYQSTTIQTFRSKQDVASLEMMLEAYFIQADGTLNKLSALREHIDDAEDYVNIMQDEKRNQLMQMVVVIMTATFVLSIFIVVEGIFGINIHIETFNDQLYGMQHFLWLIGGGSAGSILLFVIAILWYRHRKLM